MARAEKNVPECEVAHVKFNQGGAESCLRRTKQLLLATLYQNVPNQVAFVTGKEQNSSSSFTRGNGPSKMLPCALP